MKPRTSLLFDEKKINKPKITLKLLLIGIGYGVVVGSMFYMIGDSQSVELIVNIIFMIVFVVAIKMITKEKMIHAILAYAIAFIVGLLIQFPLIIITLIFNVSNNIYVALISQIIVLASVILICKRIALYDIFLFIKMSITLVDVTFTFSVGLLLLLYFVHELITARWINLAISLIMAVSFYKMAVYTMKLKEERHDTRNLLTGIDFLLQTEKDPEKLESHYTQTLKGIGFDIPEMKAFKAKNYEDNLLTFIENQKQAHQSRAEVITNINYYYENEQIPIPIIVQMLGTFLDNAFDTKTKKPILVSITVEATNLEIIVENESDRKSTTEIDLMFGRKSSTKEGDRGYGLSKLLKDVRSYNGDVNANCRYRQEFNSYYLSVGMRVGDKTE